MYNVIIVLYCVFVTIISATISELNFQEQCMQGCPFQNRTDYTTHFGVGCGNECDIEQCVAGCQLWRDALDSSCQTVCNGTQELLPPKQLYCIIGCNDAVNRYMNQLRSELGKLPAPALVADSLKATSLSLEWSWHQRHPLAEKAHMKYLVQWRYEELANAWQYCRNQTWNSNHDIVFVDNLQPHTKYRFRVAVLLWPSYTGEPVVSEPSVVISTLPLGVPSSPPVIVRAVAVDSSRISISWEPGPFPNGPILSYVLQIVSQDHHPVLKDVPVTNSQDFYMFKHLKPSRNYTVSVAMRNGFGQGPAASITVETPSENIVNQTDPILILGTRYTVIQQSGDMIEDPIILYKSRSLIKGVAIHVNYKLLFVSDSEGYVWQTSLENHLKKHRTPIIKPESMNSSPLDLSIDWLNDHLYILEEVTHSIHSRKWQITRCQLNGHSRVIALAGLSIKPYHFEVDPFNGYLFWVNNMGLLRIDLADISNGIRREVLPKELLHSSSLGAFTVDYTHFRLLVPHQYNNTVLSVSLDGREVLDVRINTQSPMFNNVTSMAMANGLFYWTNGIEVIAEEYDKKSDNYFHNTFPNKVDNSFISLTINLPTSQPIPVPVNPPTSVQAILGSSKAKVSWHIPHLLGGQGKGAWQNWSYELQIRDTIHEEILTYRNINVTAFTVNNLNENTEYVFKANAYTKSGRGPWSSEFRGRTLHKTSNAKFVWSAKEGLLWSDVTGDNVHILLHKSSIYYVTDITWFENTLYMVTNTTHVYYYDISAKKLVQMVDIDSANSIAIDWIGKKLYWSNPKQQLITRGNLNGGKQEPLPILTLAKELNVDSVNAYIYWSTGHAVECARLNGSERRVYYPAQLFSGKQVMGLTIDIQQHTIYWIVRSYEGAVLFHASTAEKLTSLSEPITHQQHLQDNDIQGPLCFFSQRLLWLQDPNNTIIADLNGQNTAILSGTRLNGLKMVTVKDDALHIYPSNLSKHEINVIPNSVSPQSIRIVGSWDSFNITWESVSNVNYGQVFYEIQGGDKSYREPNFTTETSIAFWKELPPYSELEISIRAFTYWGSALPTRVHLHSPPSTPSKPESVSAFITSNKRPFSEKETIGIIRWSQPIDTNGIIKSYRLDCWTEDSKNGTKEIISYQLDATSFEFLTGNLLPNYTYYFQLCAYTEVGYGELSEIVHIRADDEKYLPTLMVASEDKISIKDCHNGRETVLKKSNGKIIDIAYLYNERKVIWLNDLQEIFISSYNTSSSHGHRVERIKLVTLNSTGVCISVDWIQRFIYWVQFDPFKQQSSIHVYDLNTINDGIVHIRTILTRPTKIHHLEVSPLKSTLYWMESSPIDDNINILKFSNLEGHNIQTFFSNDPGNLCNCTFNVNIDRTFSLRTDASRNLKILFINKKLQKIIEADMTGCYCKVLSSTSVNDLSRSLTADPKNFYYLNNGKIYTNNNSACPDKAQIEIIKSFGPNNQLFPVEEYCLKPNQIPLQISLHNRSANYFILKMPKPARDSECNMYKMPTIRYTIYYKIYSSDDLKECDNSSNIAVTYDAYIKISKLKPFTKYLFCLSVSNYYTRIANESIVIGSSTVFQTAAGAPSKAENITAIVLNPTTVKVSWNPPKKINDEMVTYEVHWCTEESAVGLRSKGEFETVTGNEVILRKLLPNHAYSILIRTHSPNSEIFTDSDPIRVVSYPDPNNIEIQNITAYSVDIAWEKSENITAHYIKYIRIGTNSWQKLTNDSLIKIDDNKYYYKVTGLKPKTQYKFALVLDYLNFNDTYTWPNDARFKFQTLGDKPSAPGKPIVEQVRADVYRVIWEIPNDNGSPIREYRLEGHSNTSPRISYTHKPLERKRRNTKSTNTSNISEIVKKFMDSDLIIETNEKNPRNVPDNYSKLHNIEPYIDEDEAEWEWETYYNGSENYWLIRDLIPTQKYWFRVCANNEYGWGPYSDISDVYEAGIEMSGARLAHHSQQFTIFLAIAVPILATVCVISFCTLFCICKRKVKNSKTPPTMAPITTLRPDMELAILRDMPRGRSGGTFVHSTNVLYTSSDIPLGDSPESLPHIRRDQITLTKFLGSGAFGEVFEGKAKGLDEQPGETRVAVKTLRKGASAQERAEFLREAQLMAHFKHNHILKLLGVCRDNDPHFIIMELMQAGDLLTYLRTLRPLAQTPQALTLRDLVEMCVDVAKGCCYLEEQHFVHRDLACRNCLVSSADPATRVVKIGDFGLARDIYKNDYYRKEGEGLLPVRWMAPESLVDGVFTSQSDVWAFGVLMWEIMTLGQQPYPARTNLEVLHYVRTGGRLHRPNDCPEELHQLMLKCWSYNPECRPTFKYCLEVLEKLKQRIINNTLQLDSSTTVDNSQNRGSAENCLANPSYMLDHNSNFSETSDVTRALTFTNNEPSQDPPETIRELSSLNVPTEIPKYLELIYDAEDVQPPEPLTSIDGYEVPRSSIRSNKSIAIEPIINRLRRPLSANASLQRNHSTNRFQPRVYRSNSSVSNHTRTTSLPRAPLHSINRSNSLIRPKSGITSANFNHRNNNEPPTNAANGDVNNSSIILRNNSDMNTSERLLPSQNVIRCCTYSNITQAQKPLLTDITPITSVANETRHGNRRSFNNSHSIC